MKILYGIQGTGNGHIARAEDIIPLLKEYGTVDLLVSGAQADIKLSYPVKYKSKGLSFFFGKSGGIDFLKTFKHNSTKRVYREIHEFPIDRYDLVINDFEPISSWAAKQKKVPCVALSHQAALLSSKVPQPKHFDPVGEWVLQHYAPSQAQVSFHFAQFDKNIFTPVIRNSIRQLQPEVRDHYTVYLPAYDDQKIVPLLARIKHVRWHIFSKHTRKPYHVGTLSVYPVDKENFTASMVTARGVLCGAGFETPAEALYLGKKLLVIPMKRQYEQHYNAAALRELGVPVVKKLKKKHIPKIAAWIESDHPVEIHYPDNTAEAVERAIRAGGF